MKNLLEKYSQKIYDGNIILLCNVFQVTPIMLSDKLNIVAEFFSQEEFDYILSNLKKCGYNVLAYFDENQFIADSLNGKLKGEFLVFNLSRNGYGIGKKSLIPTFCDLNSIKYTASDGYACSFARSKYHINALLNYMGLNALESYVYDGSWLNDQQPSRFNRKYIIKPLCESASQGISEKSIYNGSTKRDFDTLIQNTYISLNNTPLIVQQFVEGYEAKTTIIDFDKSYVLPPVGVEINGTHNLQDAIISEEIAFDYRHKNYILADELGVELANKVATQALAIYKGIGMKNYGRIDCRIDSKTKEIYFMDFSTMPYFVSGGEVLYAFETLGQDIQSLLHCLINSALISKYNYSL